MTVNYTTNLALGQPVTGTESGTWGDDVNNAVTSYLDIAIAGGLAITVTTADVTLTITQGTSVATNIGSTTAQYAILNVSGAMTAARNLIVPSSSRIYLINNNTTGGFALTVKGSATSGVTLVNGEKAHVFWNGTDYAKLSNASGGAGVFSSITNSGLTSGRVVYSTTGGLETDSANLTFNGTTLTANTIGAFTLSGTIAGGGNQINNVIIGTTTPLAGAFTTLTTSSTVTINGGTANGVAYLNASKVLTSAATFIWTGATAQLGFQNAAANGYAYISNVGLGTNTDLAFLMGATEVGRFSSTALALQSGISLTGGTSGTGYSFSGSAPAGSLALDSSGNLGLGVTPSAWGSGQKALQVGAYAALWYNSGFTRLASNVYDNGTNVFYLNTAAASYYQQNAGAHAWFNAASGTAGNAITFTQAMTLDSSGNLLVGVTTANANGGVLQLKSGITFPATAVAATDANTLDDYDEYTATSAACTGAITTAVVWKLTKVGNVVTLVLPATTGTASAATNIQFGTSLPAKYRPVANTAFLSAPITDNAAESAVPGIVLILANGTIYIYKNGTFTANFTASATAGISYPTSVSWTI